MDTKQFYSNLLGLKDHWYVDRVEMDEKGERIDVYVAHHNPIRISCPECGAFFAENSSQESLEQNCKRFIEKEKASVTAVTMDRWGPFIDTDAIRETVFGTLT